MVMLDNISLGKYLLLPDEEKTKYLFLEHINFTEEIKGKDLLYLTFGEVKIIVGSDILEGIKVIYKLSEKQLFSMKILEFFKRKKYVETLLENIYKIMESWVVDEDNEAWKIASGNTFEKYGIENITIKLIKEYGIEPNNVDDILFKSVNLLMLYSKDLSDTEKKYKEIQDARRKRTF